MTTLGIFLKPPIPGSVKTRLGESIGMQAAADVSKAFQQDVLERTQGLAERRVLAIASGTIEIERSPDVEPPGERGGVSPPFLSRSDFAATDADEIWLQPQGPLGDRLNAFFSDWCRPAESCVVIGSDSPNLPVVLIQQAFAELEFVDCVLGPAWDGGYYLVGLKGPFPELFQNIDWSTSRVLLQSLSQLERAGRSWSLLPAWYDVDTLADLRWLDAHLAAERFIGQRPEPVQATRNILHDFQL